MKTTAITNLLLFVLLINSYSQNVNCILKGEVYDTVSKHLILVKESENARQEGIEIPIISNTFKYSLEVQHKEKYTLFLNNEVIKGVAWANDFIAENDTLIFELYPYAKRQQNTIKGGKLTQELHGFYKLLREIFEPKLEPFYLALDSLDKANNLYNNEMVLINRKIKEETDSEKKQLLYMTKNNLHDSRKGFSPEAILFYSKIDSVIKLVNDWQLDYVSKKPDILSYYILLSMVRGYSKNDANINTTILFDLVQDYSINYPSHPYTQKIQNVLNSIKSVKIGEPYIDFVATTVNGERIQLSDMIDGKVALINLWASWCGPCLALNRSMIPVYEKYKNKGFTIIGVAREYKNSDAFMVTLEKEKYPWLNLLELDNQYGIWDKYGVTNTSGATFLVNEDGIIVAIYPDSKELDRLLSKMID